MTGYHKLKPGPKKERKTRVGDKVESGSGRNAHQMMQAGHALALRLSAGYVERETWD